MTGESASRNEPPALDAVEEAILLLKRAGPSAYGAYAAGTLGFLWALLFFWAYMSRNAMAEARIGEFSMLLAAAFLGMKVCHALFFRRLMHLLEETEPRPPSPGLLLKTVLAQSLLQPLSLIAIPLALALTFPFPFVAAFFQNAFWVRDTDGFSSWMSRSFRMARLWPKQNMQIHLFLAGAGPCVALNVITALVTGPMLLKSFLGVESVFTRTPSAYLNTTFILAALALSWALLDPVIKAIHAWRCFHGLSLSTGLDLRQALARYSRPAPAYGTVAAPGATLALAIALGASGAWGNPKDTLGGKPLRSAAASRPVAVPRPASDSRPTSASPLATPVRPVSSSGSGKEISPEMLRTLLKREISESRYGWRRPRDGKDGEAQSWVFLQTKKAMHAIGGMIRKIRSLWLRFSDWFNGLFGNGGKAESRAASAAPSPMPTRILVAVLCALFSAIAAYFLLRRLRDVPEAAPVPAAPIPKVPDAAREDVKADDFPEEEWLRLMESLRSEGQSRLALRALFLATLSLLARKGWVTLARHKSNRDYQREVSARARRNPDADACFRENCRRFDRVWYGRHEVTEEDWDVSRANFAMVRSDGEGR